MSAGKSGFIGSGPGFGGFIHGFLFSHGLFTTLQSPNKGDTNFRVQDINNKGQIVGSCGHFMEGKPLMEGFVLSGSFYTLLDAPNHKGESDANSLNNEGEIVGLLSERTLEAVQSNSTVSVLQTKICLWENASGNRVE